MDYIHFILGAEHAVNYIHCEYAVSVNYMWLCIQSYLSNTVPCPEWLVTDD